VFVDLPLGRRVDEAGHHGTDVLPQRLNYALEGKHYSGHGTTTWIAVTVLAYHDIMMAEKAGTSDARDAAPRHWELQLQMVAVQ
jgi:hypothetical protein